MPVEVELKLALAPEAATRLRRSALLKGRPAVRRKLTSLYYDTPDFALMRRGVALRVRRVGRRWIQTLKAEASAVGALSARPEWEVAVPAKRPDIALLPEAARALIPPEAAGALRPCFVTEFRRTAWEIGEGDGRLELALDQGRIQAAGRSLPISEVELELLSGPAGFLFDVAEALQAAVPLQIEPRSKARRGYELAGAVEAAPHKARPPAIEPGEPAARAWQAMLAAALGQLVANLPGLPDGEDPEYLHQTRVAIRRLRAALGLARSIGMDAPPWAAELRWLMGELSPARDWDVFATQTLPRLGPLLGERLALLERPVAAARRAAHRRALQATGSERLVRLVLAAGRTIAQAAAEGEAAQDWASAVLSRRLKRLKRAGRRFESLDAPARHRVRIAAKKLRYAADAFAALYGARAGRYIQRLARLQDALGAANDAAVAARLLAELDLRQPNAACAAGFVEGCLGGEAREREAGVAEAWEALRRARPFWGKAGRAKAR